MDRRRFKTKWSSVQFQQIPNRVAVLQLEWKVNWSWTGIIGDTNGFQNSAIK